VARTVEISARTLLRRSKLVDSWFLCRYGMNLYRGCAHACAYCDGRAEKYAVEGDFGEEITVKVNAVELLAAELERKLQPGYFLLGGGVCDAYQPAEERYALARGCLELLRDRVLPVHVLTKSTLVRRDADLLAAINACAGAIVSVSVSTLDQGLADLVEPGCAPVEDRLRVLEEMKALGLGVGVMLMPVLPFLSDDEPALRAVIERAAAAGADFVLLGGLTLKPGRQMDHLLAVLRARDPALAERYRALYPGDRWGNARGDATRELQRRFLRVVGERSAATPACGAIPLELYRGRLGRNLETALVLAQIHELLQLRGEHRPEWLAASRALQSLHEDVDDLARAGLLPRLAGLAPRTERVVRELLETGDCRLYRTLLRGGQPTAAERR
jgi:DNA repair photolyase